MRLLRSLLFVPANRERMLAKAADAGADAVVLDLEDAVPAAERKAARRLARSAVRQLARAGAVVFVRVNGVPSGETRDDLMAVVRKGLAGVVLPKAEHPQDLRDLDVLLREAEMASKVRPGDVALVPIIESPRGVLRCEQIAQASDRVVALSVGGEDYTAALGVPRGAAALAQLRYTVVTVAAAYELSAIDTPYPDIADRKGLAAEASLVRSMGFAGKYVVHPGQVAAVNRAFSPARGDVAAARRILAAADASGRAGEGSFSVDGRMVDAPVVARARALIALDDAVRSRRR